MADPAVITCAADAWTAVAVDTNVGIFNKINTTTQYTYTYRETGTAAPTAGDVADSVSWISRQLRLQHATNVDVYIWAHDAAGAVEVEL
jgi:hypothetical protein